MIVCLVKSNRFAFSETFRELNMECKRLLTRPTVFDSALLRSDPSVFISLMLYSRRTVFKSM